MLRHHSIGPATLAALMAADRPAPRAAPPRRGAIPHPPAAPPPGDARVAANRPAASTPGARRSDASGEPA
ncbi:hypothetical protein CKO45_09900 [Paracraurococcus ruber]|uniref:Uncharacterized protein n=1 Tax=Paracraurococcus ruber TaxID=77675 RepID=A0ABS1CVY8_9PROT|nr:hypothetical protein [Paracraurococcus ruber]